MLKLRIILKILIIFFLNLNYLYSHHKDGLLEKIIEVNLDKDKITILNENCAYKAEQINEPKNNLSDKKVGPPTEEEKKENLDSTTKSWKISSYHETQGRPLETVFPENIIILKKIKKDDQLNWDFNPDDKLSEILSKLCLHSTDKEISNKIDEDLFTKIAEANNLKKSTDKITDEIYENGIIIPEEVGSLIVHYPDFLDKDLKKIERLKEEKKQRDTENKWVDENKSDILAKAESYKKRQDDLIKELNKKLQKNEVEFSNLQKNFDTVNRNVKKLIEINIQNKTNEQVAKAFGELFDLKEEYLVDNEKIENISNEIKNLQNNINNYFKSNNLATISKIIANIETAKSRKKLENLEEEVSKLRDLNVKSTEDQIELNLKNINEYNAKIDEIESKRLEVLELDKQASSSFNYFNLIFYVIGFILIAGVITFIFLQKRKIESLTQATDSAGKKFSELEGQLRTTSQRIESVNIANNSLSNVSTKTTNINNQTQEQITINKFDELVSDYFESIDDFSKVASLKEKWNGQALSRKERQDGSKTILIFSSRAFEKSEIWCLNFEDKFFAFPGSSVKNNMAVYMNLDYEKAQRDFKGVFVVSSGTNYSTEPAIIKKTGASFIVERTGKLVFPS